MTWSRGKDGLWALADSGLVDPRPKMMNLVRDDFDRIYNHGGIFIVFAAPRITSRYIIASDPGRHSVRSGFVPTLPLKLGVSLAS